MSPAEDASSRALWEQWLVAAAQPDVHQAFMRLFDQLQKIIDTHQPTCALSGCCCRFASYGHRLYLTGLEVAWTVRQLEITSQRNLNQHDGDELTSHDGCPFQIQGMCSVHTVRPMGCRIYFCDPAAQTWQPEIYEQMHQQIQQLHQQHALSYRYMEWRAALADMLRFPPQTMQQDSIGV